jgi:HTH-type transcriptional regulator/antitoxin HigA
MARKRDESSIAAVYGRRQDRYLELVRRFPLRPIDSKAELDDAIMVIDSLIDQDELNDAELDYLDVLSDLVEAYEEVNDQSGPVAESELLRFLVESKDVTQVEVSKATGIAESTISEILSGKRKLTRSQITKLARYFHVEAGVFLASD